LLLLTIAQFPGDGVPIKWHRDASAASVDNRPAIDVGIYLDEANTQHDNCLYVIPGTQKWPDMMASAMIDHLTSDGTLKRPSLRPQSEQNQAAIKRANNYSPSRFQKERRYSR
jgi:ectoine hydroxylase-related dioxygenase (phytanoyl-CoA dioxygenase family)